MKYARLLLRLSMVVSISMLLTQCKKEEATLVAPPYRVTQIYSDSAALSYIFDYTPAVKLESRRDNIGKFWTHFHNNGSRILEEPTLYGNSQASVPNTLYFINSQGLADSSVEVYPSGSLGIRKKYTYDSGLHLAQVIWTDAMARVVLTESYTILNGNVVSHSFVPADPSATSLPTGTYEYTYYNDMANKVTNENFGQHYFGTSSLNMLKTVSYNNGTSITTATHSYSFDEQSRPVTEVIYDESGLRVDSLVYSYTTF